MPASSLSSFVFPKAKKRPDGGVDLVQHRWNQLQSTFSRQEVMHTRLRWHFRFFFLTVHLLSSSFASLGFCTYLSSIFPLVAARLVRLVPYGLFCGYTSPSWFRLDGTSIFWEIRRLLFDGFLVENIRIWGRKSVFFRWCVGLCSHKLLPERREEITSTPILSILPAFCLDRLYTLFYRVRKLHNSK